MGFRFRRSFKIAPGIRLNINSKSTSVRIGPKGLGYTVSSNGTKRVSASIPGTGISYSEVTSPKQKAPVVQPQARSIQAPQKAGRIWTAVLLVAGLIVVANVLNNAGARSSGSRPLSPATSVEAALPQQPPQITRPSPAEQQVRETPVQQVTSTPPSATLLPTAAPRPTLSQVTPQIRFVTASSLNVRDAPNPSGGILGKIPNGHQIAVIEKLDGWLLVESAAAGRGWVSEQYTSPNRPVLAPSPPPQALVSTPQPGLTRDAIIQAIINRSIRSYSGNCPCPYNTTASGRRCGGNSAYSRPGGRSPLCFPSDVTEAMIAAFRP